MFEELIGEGVVRSALALTEALWTRMTRPGAFERDDARWRSARAFLSRHAASAAETPHELTARMGAARGGAAVSVDRSRERVRITCAWDGDDVELPPTDPRFAALPRLFAALARVGGIDAIASHGRRLDVRGTLTLAAELDHATRIVAEITSCGRRLREQLAESKLDHHELAVEVSGEGAYVVQQRAVATDGPLSFSIARDGSVAHLGARRTPSTVVDLLGHGPVRVEIAAGRARVCWSDVPDAHRVARAERALALLGAGRSAYR